MDWPLAIDRNTKALRQIVAALFAMLGVAGGRSLSGTVSRAQPVPERGLRSDAAAVFTLPRHVYAAIMLILRPAESALRRLIVIAAHGLKFSPRAPRPVPVGLAGFAGFAASSASRTPSFNLFDPLKLFSLEAYNNNPQPQFGFVYVDEAEFFAAHLQSTEPVNAALLFTRLRAIRAALNDIPRQAKRLARWQARQDLARREKRPLRPARLSTCRPGLPPGWRERRIHEVDDVLRECHRLVWDIENLPDTG